MQGALPFRKTIIFSDIERLHVVLNRLLFYFIPSFKSGKGPESNRMKY
ncbi:hypothetical protein Ppha_0054 [Pelodictyon phaeoclathratiforme BU-1]|jgi:hypothetical protein|uniref:Uncharacterized protein n=1 Tax=Pelodictyon phaeoclathratiforme (strain DSM 5477 / BU-1) TaxID=324925 RepID=B4SAP2_PELPB|nr:hypothetical protein Ppha_0054 [Pelodictyon phaeoclathratiforme BU-1]